ncbi:MAG: hypothetical protein M3511_14335, partial [Deinococcota bacterium]|nr:hypothetical protein [Deinococcota bacterium]
MLAALGVLAFAAAGDAQEVIWQGEITRTESFSKAEYGRQESHHREERWSDFRVRRGAAGEASASFDATWAVRETRSSSSTDCSSTGEATESGLYPWFLFELNPFDELSYMLYSGGYGGGPDATGVMTVNCRGQAPYSFEYEVQASWLPAASFPLPHGVLDGFSQEELDSMPQETLDLMLELDAMLEQDAYRP